MKRPSWGAADALYAGNEDTVVAVIERAELHKTIWRIANDLRGLFGGAYDYLMTMYASSAGKPDADFYTPQEMVQVTAAFALDGRSGVVRVCSASRTDWIQICGSDGLAA